MRIRDLYGLCKNSVAVTSILEGTKPIVEQGEALDQARWVEAFQARLREIADDRAKAASLLVALTNLETEFGKFADEIVEIPA